MKRNLLYKLFGFVFLLSAIACSKEDRYETSVVRQVDLSLNGQPWKLNVGISTKPFFVYKRPSGEYFANYTSHYRFSLPNGGYWFLATPAPATLIPDSVATTNLKDLVINQFPRADQQVEISAAAEFNSPFDRPLTLNMITRTGTLRLKATDAKSDARYTSVRAVVTVNRSAYRVADESYVESPLEVIRVLKTDKGGVNYTDDFIVFATKDEQSGVSIRFELLDNAGNIVRTRSIDTPVQVLSNARTLVEFSLNDSDEPIIGDYKVTMPTTP